MKLSFGIDEHGQPIAHDDGQRIDPDRAAPMVAQMREQAIGQLVACHGWLAVYYRERERRRVVVASGVETG